MQPLIKLQLNNETKWIKRANKNTLKDQNKIRSGIKQNQTSGINEEMKKNRQLKRRIKKEFSF